MKQTFELTITGDIPETDPDLGHDAVVATKAPAHAIAIELEALGLLHVRQIRRIVRKKDAAAKAAPLGIVPAAAE
jgi:hypothetical protein